MTEKKAPTPPSAKKPHDPEVIPPAAGASSSAPTSASPAQPEPAPRRGFLGLFKRRGPSDSQVVASRQGGAQELVDLIRAIRVRMDQQNEIQERLVDVLQKLPDAMGSGRNRVDEQLVESITKFNSTLEVIDRTQSSHAQTVTRLMERSRESETVLQNLLIKAERRNALGNVLMMLIALLLAGGAVFFYIETRERDRAGSPPPAPEGAPAPAPSPAVRAAPSPLPEADFLPPDLPDLDVSAIADIEPGIEPDLAAPEVPGPLDPEPAEALPGAAAEGAEAEPEGTDVASPEDASLGAAEPGSDGETTASP